MQELKSLLARALAYIEDPESLTDYEKEELEEDLKSKIEDLEEKL